MRFSTTRWCMSCFSHQPPGGPNRVPWRCKKCRDAIKARNDKLQGSKVNHESDKGR